MSIRNTFSVVIFVVMLILVKVSVLAGEPQIIESSSINVVTASPGANAAWIKREIDTSLDKGQKLGARMSLSSYDKRRTEAFKSIYYSAHFTLKARSDVI